MHEQLRWAAVTQRLPTSLPRQLRAQRIRGLGAPTAQADWRQEAQQQQQYPQQAA